jgi:hypothetical protein
MSRAKKWWSSLLLFAITALPKFIRCSRACRLTPPRRQRRHRRLSPPDLHVLLRHPLHKPWRLLRQPRRKLYQRAPRKCAVISLPRLRAQKLPWMETFWGARLRKSKSTPAPMWLGGACLGSRNGNATSPLLRIAVKRKRNPAEQPQFWKSLAVESRGR